MPARDIHHDLVHRILVADGWHISHDPYRIVVGRKNLFVDLGAERIFAAARYGKYIAVNVKSFEGPSEVQGLEEAVAEHFFCLRFLRDQEPERHLYMAIPGEVFSSFFEEPLGQLLLAVYDLRLLVYDPLKEVILQWIPTP